jgi:hypothetical protein
MAQNISTHFPTGVNLYVPEMHYHSDVDATGSFRADLGTPVTIDADGILDGVSIAVAGQTLRADFNALYSPSVMGRYGRNVTVVASGAATSAVTVHGYDYLGQPMSETLTLNGATPVVGVKCFGRVLAVEYAATADRTIDVGWGLLLGLPYAAVAVEQSFENGVAVNAASFTAGVLTDPQTATTGDPRGRISFTNAPNGSRHYEVAYFVNRDNLHGVAHFAA